MIARDNDRKFSCVEDSHPTMAKRVKLNNYKSATCNHHDGQKVRPLCAKFLMTLQKIELKVEVSTSAAFVICLHPSVSLTVK